MENTKLLQLTKINYQTYYERRLFTQNGEIIKFVSFDEQISEIKESWIEATRRLTTFIAARLNAIQDFDIMLPEQQLRYLALNNYESFQKISSRSSYITSYLELTEAEKYAWLKATEAVLRNLAKILMDIADSSGGF